MLRRLLHLIATQPELLAQHAHGYLELVSAETGSACATWRRRTLLYAVALCCLLVAAVLAGVAGMLWAVLPAVPLQALWVLIGAPLIAAAVALVCLRAARPQGDDQAFDNLRQQIREDLQLLREVNAP